jgi:hypothetical protein
VQFGLLLAIYVAGLALVLIGGVAYARDRDTGTVARRRHSDGVRLGTRYHEAPLAYLLSAFSGLVYVVATCGAATAAATASSRWCYRRSACGGCAAPPPILPVIM